MSFFDPVVSGEELESLGFLVAGSIAGDDDGAANEKDTGVTGVTTGERGAAFNATFSMMTVAPETDGHAAAALLIDEEVEGRAAVAAADVDAAAVDDEVE